MTENTAARGSSSLDSSSNPGLRSRTTSPLKAGQTSYEEQVDVLGDEESVDEKTQRLPQVYGLGLDQPPAYTDADAEANATGVFATQPYPSPHFQPQPRRPRQRPTPKQKQKKRHSPLRRILTNLFLVFLFYLVLKVYIVGQEKRAKMREKWERERIVHASR